MPSTRVTEELRGFDAVIKTGFTDVMHLCGLPAATIAGTAVNEHGIPRCLILYSSDEQKLYAAALAIEKMI